MKNRLSEFRRVVSVVLDAVMCNRARDLQDIVLMARRR
jgi:hypothetical protein